MSNSLQNLIFLKKYHITHFTEMKIMGTLKGPKGQRISIPQGYQYDSGISESKNVELRRKAYWAEKAESVKKWGQKFTEKYMRVNSHASRALASRGFPPFFMPDSIL